MVQHVNRLLAHTSCIKTKAPENTSNNIKKRAEI